MKSTPPPSRGFTLIELMVTVLLVAVLAALAAPSLTQFIRSSRLSGAATQFVADLQLARREAIKRNAPVLVCQGAAGDCGTATAWGTAGWRVCHDTDLNDQCDATATTDPNPIVKRNAIDATAITITQSGSSGSVVQFNANGTQGDAGAATITFAVTGTGTGRTYTATITASGHIALAKPS